jgi:hypothetical protein
MNVSKKGIFLHEGIEKAESCFASFNVLFLVPRENGFGVRDLNREPFLKLCSRMLKLIRDDLISLKEKPSTARRISCRISDTPDSVDMLNGMAEEFSAGKFGAELEACVFDVLGSFGFLAGKDIKAFKGKNSAVFYLNHASNLFETLKKLVPDYIKLLKAGYSKKSLLARVNPEASGLCVKTNPFKIPASGISSGIYNRLKKMSTATDPFAIGRAFRFFDGEFVPVELSEIRPVNSFFGYHEAKIRFREYFNDFASGSPTLPLLISSLPGLGKTHFTIAHTLAHENLTLILPEPAYLEKPLEAIIRRLAIRRNRMFVIFFDDINTSGVDWYYFRTNVGGSFVLPPNITIVIASNYRFPANILSRGRSFEFPMFDEIRCREMIYDFLSDMRMKKPASELVDVIAADYVEEFGQRRFEELSPRTLARYLEKYENDLDKRKRMLDISKEEVVSRPDAAVFFDLNIKLVRSFYGEDAIEELQRKQLGE